jgi:transcriptional regulator with XRE-family HTH domain
MAQLAKVTGLNISYLWHLENGRFLDIGLEKFCRIAAALGLSADDLLTESGYLPRPTSRPQKGTNQ